MNYTWPSTCRCGSPRCSALTDFSREFASNSNILARNKSKTKIAKLAVEYRNMDLFKKKSLENKLALFTVIPACGSLVYFSGKCPALKSKLQRCNALAQPRLMEVL